MILVDFDRTLATYSSWHENGKSLGAPIAAMVGRVKEWLEKGMDVRIFTARACKENPARAEDILAIQNWCVTHLGKVLPVQNWKNFETKFIFDDIAVTVEANTGRILTPLDA